MPAARRRVRISEKTGQPIGLPEPAENIEPEPPGSCDCPLLDPEDWHEVESDWHDIAFVKTSTNAVAGVPVGFNGTRDELRKKAASIGATVPEDAMLLLGSGKFRRPVMLEVEAGDDLRKGVERPGGVAYTRMVPAPWGEMGKQMEITIKEARERMGRDPDDTWVWYLTCGICSGPRGFETLFVAHFKPASK